MFIINGISGEEYELTSTPIKKLKKTAIKHEIGKESSLVVLYHEGYTPESESIIYSIFITQSVGELLKKEKEIQDAIKKSFEYKDFLPNSIAYINGTSESINEIFEDIAEGEDYKNLVIFK